MVKKTLNDVRNDYLNMGLPVEESDSRRNMNCTNQIRITKNLNPSEFPDGLLVPCGKCLPCRAQKKREWAMRLFHELDSWDDGVFITLTYDEEHIPEYGTISKRDLQLFFKRLRKRIEPKKIKYYACGEYGKTTQRPHYHAIIFGLSVQDSKIIEEVWDEGFITTGLVEPASIDYVCKYIDKKLSGELEEMVYTQTKRLSPFKICSLGMGLDFVKKNMKQLIENEKITVFGVEQTFPRYYLKHLGMEKSDFRKEKAKEKEVARIKKLAGVELSDDDFYKRASAEEYMKYYEKHKANLKQKSKTMQALIDMRTSKL